MATFQWVPDYPAGVMRNHALSKKLRYASIAECKFMQFSRPEPGYGQRMGDTITIPPKNCFDSERDRYQTLIHEEVHATAHPTRLNRDLRGRFGSDSYAFEELVAELGAAYVCAHFGIEAVGNSAAYLFATSGFRAR